MSVGFIRHHPASCSHLQLTVLDQSASERKRQMRNVLFNFKCLNKTAFTTHCFLQYGQELVRLWEQGYCCKLKLIKTIKNILCKTEWNRKNAELSLNGANNGLQYFESRKISIWKKPLLYLCHDWFYFQFKISVAFSVEKLIFKLQIYTFKRHFLTNWLSLF